MTSADITAAYGQDHVQFGDLPVNKTAFSKWGFDNLTKESIDHALKGMSYSPLIRQEQYLSAKLGYKWRDRE